VITRRQIDDMVAILRRGIELTQDELRHERPISVPVSATDEIPWRPSSSPSPSAEPLRNS